MILTTWDGVLLFINESQQPAIFFCLISVNQVNTNTVLIFPKSIRHRKGYYKMKKTKQKNNNNKKQNKPNEIRKNSIYFAYSIILHVSEKATKEKSLFLLFGEIALLKARGWLNYSGLLEGILRRFSRPAGRWIMKVACEIFILYHWRN